MIGLIIVQGLRNLKKKKNLLVRKLKKFNALILIIFPYVPLPSL